MNKIWYILIVLGLVICVCTNNVEHVGAVILESGTKTFDVFLKIALLILFWNGIFNIAIQSGMIKHLTNRLRRPLAKLFPEVDPNSLAMEYICSNIVANVLGLGSAATPLGLKAMEELQKENPNKQKANRSMVTFVLLNVSTLTIFPTTIIGLRKAYHGESPFNLILLLILVTVFSTCIAILFDRIFYHFEKRKKKKCKSLPYTLL